MQLKGLTAYKQIQETVQGTEKGSRPVPGFRDMLNKAVSKVNDDILEAQQISERMAKGEPVDVADTMIAISKADVSFRLLMQVRNRALSAYEEIMRMQF